MKKVNAEGKGWFVFICALFAVTVDQKVLLCVCLCCHGDAQCRDNTCYVSAVANPVCSPQMGQPEAEGGDGERELA